MILYTSSFVIFVDKHKVPPEALFSLYIGLVTTLIVRFSQILCIRALVTTMNLSGIFVLSGSMIKQLLIIQCILFTPIYRILQATRT